MSFSSYHSISLALKELDNEQNFSECITQKGIASRERAAAVWKVWMLQQNVSIQQNHGLQWYDFKRKCLFYLAV